MSSQTFKISLKGLGQILHLLKDQGYCLIGPTVRDQAIIYDEINGLEDLPRGITEVQDAGTYRLKNRGDEALFGYTVGPQSWKKFLHEPKLTLFKARKNKNGFQLETPPKKIFRYAFIGVRGCDLKAIMIQDRVFLGDTFQDPHYAQRRQDNFIWAVNCTQSASTCFCTSMGTGPQVQENFDLALTELCDEKRHAFFITSGSVRGEEILKKLHLQAASSEDLKESQERIQQTAQSMQRHLSTSGIEDLLKNNAEHPRWQETAERCLACTNCTMVCPTCFCTAVEDVTDLEGQEATRIRRWDSCFTLDFSHVSGGSVRASIASRYRQWLTHKLATWRDQFGSSGCVGCGRCITWCPVGIDLTEEVAAISNEKGSLKEG